MGLRLVRNMRHKVHRKDKAKGTASDSSTDPGTQRHLTSIPTIGGSDTKQGVMTLVFTSTIRGSTADLQEALAGVMCFTWRAAPENAFGLAVSILALLPTIILTSMTGFGPAIRSLSMKTPTTVDGTSPTTQDSGLMFT